VNLYSIMVRSVRHYWRTNVFIVLGVAVATAVMTGSLLVGDSMQASLRHSVLSRLGNVDRMLITAHTFPADLAERLSREAKVRTTPLLMTRGAARSAGGKSRAGNVTVMGIEDASWPMFFPRGKVVAVSRIYPRLQPGRAAISRQLAEDLKLHVGDEFLVSIDRSGSVTDDVLFAHRRGEETLRTLRLTVSLIAPESEGGDFGMEAGGAAPRNVFVEREYLARAMDRAGGANAILLSGPVDDVILRASMQRVCGLADHGLTLVRGDAGAVYLESSGLLLTDEQVSAAVEAAKDAGGRAAPGSVYLASRVKDGAKEIAYAVVSSAPVGIDVGDGAVVNAWAAEDLGAKAGDTLEVTYLVPTPEGTYEDRTQSLKVTGIVPLSGVAADRHLTPSLNGLTDAKRIAEWKLPFPVDRGRLTERDDAYWEQYGPTPKLFVPMGVMREIWGKAVRGGSGWVTSVRMVPPAGEEVAAFEKAFGAGLLKRLSPGKDQMVFRDLRATMLQSAEGSTEFGGLFLAMSFFLITAAGAMAGMLMRLLVEQRAGEIGVLLATGWRQRKAMRLLLWEGIMLTMIGVAVGVPAGVLYSAGILAALDRWWMGPWGHPVLHAEVTARSIVAGAVSGLVLGVLCVWWGVRAMGRAQPLKLLTGRQGMELHGGRARTVWPVGLAIAGAGMLLAAGQNVVSGEIGFFIGGTLILAAALMAMRGTFAGLLMRGGTVLSAPALAMRNAAANRRRSLLTVGLLACATFILVAVAANRRDYSRLDTSDKRSGAGGFELRATTSVPLHFDLGSPAGRARLGFSSAEEKVLAGTRIFGMAESAGDDVSCLNLAKPMRPRLLGATRALAEWNGFDMQGKGWEALFAGPDSEGAIPAIGDADSVQWILHSKLGGVYTFDSDDGRPVKLRIVGVIPGSIFAGELLVSDDNLRRVYPKINGMRYFLVAGGHQAAVRETLRAGLSDQGVEVSTTRDILNRYISVQNVYLAIFLSLGGLGLLLGTAGLVAVIARSVLERRGELGFMAAAGFRRSVLVRLVAMEHSGLLLGGLVCGGVAALLAVWPVLRSGRADVQWGALAALLAAVAVVGLLACIITAWCSISKQPMRALREE
jgi:ABC-type antimicrobial peptide transport system permease subunit